MENSLNQVQIIENEIQNLKIKAGQSLNSIRKNDLHELRALAQPVEIIQIILSNVLFAVNNVREISWDQIRGKLRYTDQFIESLFNRDFAAEPLLASQIEELNKLFESQPNLTENSRRFSTVVHHLASWLESSTRISLKQQELLEIRRRLRY
jgi:hypothetical protein